MHEGMALRAMPYGTNEGLLMEAISLERCAGRLNLEKAQSLLRVLVASIRAD